MQLRSARRISIFLAFILLFAAGSQATVIYDSGITALTASDPTQLGRLSRSGVPSDWSATKAFPGVLNVTTRYRFATYTVPQVAFPFLQITFDDISGNALTFASAYLNSYQPTVVPPNFGLNTNYLGDAGRSGNFFGTDPTVFQVKAPVSSNLLVVINDAIGTPAALGQDYRIIVEGFYDTNFNDSVPEPATFALSAAGFAIAGLIGFVRRSRQSRAFMDLD